MPIDEAARQADIAIAFGEPTSATLNFFDAASLMLHVSEQDWPLDYIATNPLKGSVMPSMRCAEAAAEVDALLADPALYARRQAAQAQAYAQRRRQSHDTIFAPSSDGMRHLTPPPAVQELAPC